VRVRDVPLEPDDDHAKQVQTEQLYLLQHARLHLYPVARKVVPHDDIWRKVDSLRCDLAADPRRSDVEWRIRELDVEWRGRQLESLQFDFAADPRRSDVEWRLRELEGDRHGRWLMDIWNEVVKRVRSDPDPATLRFWAVWWEE
jgi:hypothetical protein